MWRLLNRLFGWQYVFCENTATGMVVRVRPAQYGMGCIRPYSFQYHLIPVPVPLEGIDAGGWHIIPLTMGITKKQ